MKLRLVTAISALVATAALAHAQQGGSPTGVAKPTKADVQNVVQTITSDKAKAQIYCDLNKTYDQLQQADKNMIARRSKRSANRPMHWSTKSVLNTPN